VNKTTLRNNIREYVTNKWMSQEGRPWLTSKGISLTLENKVLARKAYSENLSDSDIDEALNNLVEEVGGGALEVIFDDEKRELKHLTERARDLRKSGNNVLSYDIIVGTLVPMVEEIDSRNAHKNWELYPDGITLSGAYRLAGHVAFNLDYHREFLVWISKSLNVDMPNRNKEISDSEVTERLFLEHIRKEHHGNGEGHR